MHRSLLPSILASLGYAILLIAGVMPLFEWQISEIVIKFPSNYEVDVSPSPWKASFGQSLDDGSYVFRNVRVRLDGDRCLREHMDLFVKRSQNDQAIDQVWRNIYKNISWLIEWNWIGIVLSVIYIWWFAFWHKYHLAWAFIWTGFAIFFFIFLTQIVRLAGPLHIPAYFGRVDCYGKVSFDATLLKIHYETSIVLFAGMLLELGTLGVMVREIVRAVVGRKITLN